MENLPVSQRLSRILMYSDMRIYELLAGSTSVIFSVTLIIFGNQVNSPTISIMFQLLYPYWWALFFFMSGLLQVGGSVSKKAWLRVTGCVIGILLYTFWAIAAINSQSVFWPLFFSVSVKLTWVAFRILLDKERPEKGDIL